MVMDVQVIQEKVRAYIVDTFLPGTDADTFRDSDDLLQILDSLPILRMILALEAAFAIKVKDSELSRENLGSVERLAAFIHRKLAGGEEVSPARPGPQTREAA
jgi:acyl carrier protein